MSVYGLHCLTIQIVSVRASFMAWREETHFPLAIRAEKVGLDEFLKIKSNYKISAS
jgi:hypothetical protein